MGADTLVLVTRAPASPKFYDKNILSTHTHSAGVRLLRQKEMPSLSLLASAVYVFYFVRVYSMVWPKLRAFIFMFVVVFEYQFCFVC